MPNEYQTTRSVSAIGRLAAVQAGRPSPPRLWFGYSPAACRSFRSYAVTQRFFVANAARYATEDCGPAARVIASDGTSL